MAVLVEYSKPRAPPPYLFDGFALRNVMAADT